LSTPSFVEGDENSAQDVKEILHPVKILTDLGASVLLLHFPPKDDPEGCRGSTEIFTPVSTRWNLFNKQETVINEIRLIRKKQRVKVDAEILLRYEDGAGFTTDNKPFSDIRTATEQLTELLAAQPGLTKTQLYKLATPLGLRRQVDSFLDNGITYGEIECIGNRKFGARYWLSGDTFSPKIPTQ
jgi:hypothetical protein